MIDIMIGVTAGAGGRWVLDRMARYSVTAQGANPWSLSALLNALRIGMYVERAASHVSARISSMYRSPEVNARVAGSSATSRHMEGLAVDLVPAAPFTPESAARALVGLGRAGALGPLRSVIWEPTWVHLDWFRPGEPNRPFTTRRMVRDASNRPTYSEWSAS